MSALPLIFVCGPSAALRLATWQAMSGAAAEWRVQTERCDSPRVDAELAAASTRTRVLVDAAVQPGLHWLLRLLAAADRLAADGPAVLTTLGNRDPRLCIALAGLALPLLDSAALDRACWLLGSRVLLPVALGADSGVRLLRPGAALLHSPHWLDCTQHVHDPAVATPAPLLPADLRERAPEPLHAALSAQLLALPADAPLAAVGLDGRPVVLHLLHGWGGGAERWVLDLAQTDSARHHLLLRAVSDSGRQQHGEALQLCDARAPALPLRSIRLAPAVGNLAALHAQYAQALGAVLADFGVQQLWVSSLIGHAVQALDCGLPLRWIAHDYFPFWPVLHIDFGDPQRAFDAAAMAADLNGAGHAALAPESAASWWARRDQVIAALLRGGATLVAPSHSVLANLARIAPALQALPQQVIGHGCGLPAVALPAPPARPRPRILIPGRINGGKGEALLVQVLPQLTAVADLYLLGCGAAGMRFFGQPGVHVELEFARDHLPAAVERIAPDFALLPRTVAETFSYMLSELWTLGVPVLGTALGSLAERIRPEANGWLCAPTPAALSSLVTALSADPARVAAVRSALADQPLRDLQAMLADYLPLLPSVCQAHVTLPPPTLLLTAVEVASARADSVRLQLDLQLARAAAVAAETEVQKRGEWAHGLTRQVEERTRWAQSLEAERDQARARIDILDSEYQAQAQALAGLSETVQAQRQSLEVLDARYTQLRTHSEHTETELARLRQWLDAAEADRDQARQRIAEIERSSSWRITAPLRWLLKPWRPVRESLAFRTRSTRQLFRRGLASLRQRGLGATLQRVLRGRGQPPAASLQTAPMADPGLPFQAFALGRPDRLPLVSVIIPVYNKFPYTEACLRSLARVAEAVDFEVIVVDDGSSDETWPHLQRIGGIVAERNPQNLGFIGACNRGAELARGEYVFFLNNDTQVQDGFLTELLKVFRARPDAGLVGSRLVYPDGRLQESGGIIFSDGSGWNYGRFDDPGHCHYNFVREVDYVSGAAIALPRALFWQLGGFDRIYAPAYYEDTDLAFKVRAQAGRKVYVAPRSCVVHFEGITSGTDTGAGIKRFQVLNQAKFLERWAEVLKAHPAPGTDILKARQHRVRRRILIIDACTPMPDQDSGSLRMYNLMRLLLEEGHAVSFFAENRGWHAGYAEALQDLGVEALFHPYMPEAPEFFRQRGAEFDLVIVSRHYVLETYLPLVKSHCPRAQLWFDTVDLHYLRERRAAELAGDAGALKRAEQTQAQECALMRQCDLTLVVSPVEQEILARECPGIRVDILSNIHDIPGRRRGFGERKDLFFVGGFQHPPNSGAVLWFMEHVWPRIHAARPELKLHLVGSRTPPEISALASDHVIVHGFVHDIEPFLDGCRLSIAPLRYGAGVKGKVNLSMSYGCPVVATPVAVEGMHMSAGTDVLVADDGPTFADAVLRLHEDAALWQSLSDAGVANVTAHFSLEAARTVLRRLL